MPNRIVREGILTSERVNALTTNAEVFYRRLLSVVDDFGRYSANPTLLRAHCYPLKLDSVKEDSIKKHLAECSDAGLIVLYTVAGKGAYLEVQDFGQQIRATKSKCPSPAEQSLSGCVASDKQPLGNAHLVVSVSEDVSVSVDDRARKRAVVFVPPDWVPLKEWGDFLESRKKHPPTPRAKELLVAALEQLREQGHDPAQVLLQSTRNSWRDLFPLRSSNGSTTNRRNPSLAERAAEAERVADETLGPL